MITSAFSPALARSFAPMSNLAAPAAPATTPAAMTVDRATLGEHGATPAPDASWGTLGKIAAVTAGVIGGAVVAGAVAQATAGLGLMAGSLVVHSLYLEALPQAVSLTMLAHGSQFAVLGAAAVGAVVGGIAGNLASGKKQENPPSTVPGSGLDLSKRQHTVLNVPRWSFSALTESIRGTGEQIHDGVNGIGRADSLGGAMKAGASAGWAFGSCVGGSAGKTVGLVQGAYLGTMLAGMPLTFAPMTAVPVGFVGAWGVSQALQKAGSVAGGSLVGAGGAVVGAAGYGIKKLAEKIHG